VTDKDDIKLMPLCIPSEWEITWNCFFQISIEDAKKGKVLGILILQ
jgi:hypothetical protein